MTKFSATLKENKELEVGSEKKEKKRSSQGLKTINKHDRSKKNINSQRSLSNMLLPKENYTKANEKIMRFKVNIIAEA